MRLIDAEKLMEDVDKDFCYPEAYKKMIEKQPTAYDLDKVIENLEDYLLKELTVIVIDVNEAENRLVLSAREILKEEEQEESAL